MTWGMVAVGGATLGGAYLASQSAKGGAKSQQAATDAGIGEQRRQFDLSRSDSSPYRQAGANALEQLTGQVARSRENFDANAYLAANPDVAANRGHPAIGGIFGNLGASKGWADDPWGHYTEFGSKEGREFTFTPEAQRRVFDAEAYLRANPDVAEAGVDPFQHYQQFGRNEGRQFTQRTGELDSIAPTDEFQRLRSEMEQPITAQEVMQDPGYQFGLQQGQQALDRKIAAMGGRVSGAALKAAARFGTDYGSTGYNSAYLRRQDRMNRLAGIDNTVYQRGQDRLNRLQQLAGVGQTATNASAAAGGQTANAISSLVGAQGNASAAAKMAQANIWGSAGNQLAALYGRYGGGGGVGPGSSANTNPSSPWAQNGSDIGWGP